MNPPPVIEQIQQVVHYFYRIIHFIVSRDVLNPLKLSHKIPSPYEFELANPNGCAKRHALNQPGPL